MADVLIHLGAASSKRPCVTTLSKDAINGLCPVTLYHTPLLPSFTEFITSCNYPVTSLHVYCLSPLSPPQADDTL